MALSQASVDAIVTGLRGDPNGREYTVTGYDQYGNPKSEVIDTRKDLAEMLGRDIDISVVIVRRS